MRISPLLLALACLATTPALLRAQPPPVDPTTWPRFRGHNGAGHGELHHLPLPFGEADYNWRVPLAGSGHSSPAVWKDRIFVTGADEAQGRRYLQCLATADGRTLWQRAVEEVERRLAAYRPVETDPHIVAEMERIIRSGMSADAPLPAIPDVADRPGIEGGDSRRQRRFRR